MILRKDTEFAIHILVFYAKKRQVGDGFVYRRELLHATMLNAEPHMRICRLLSDEGLLESRPCGRAVGYRMAVAPEEITIKQIVELMQRSTELISSNSRRETIDSSTTWKKLQTKFDKLLASVTIEQLMVE